MKRTKLTKRDMVSVPRLVWGVQVLLAVVFTFTGIYKLVTPVETIIAQLPYARVYPPFAMRALGGLEVLAAIALIIPRLIGRFLWLARWAALGLSIIMIGAMELHLRHDNIFRVAINIILLALNLFVIYGLGIKKYHTISAQFEK